MTTTRWIAALFTALLLTPCGLLRAQTLEWAVDIDGHIKDMPRTGGVAVAVNAGQESIYHVGTVSGRIAGAVPALQGMVLGAPPSTTANGDLFIQKVSPSGTAAWTVQYPMFSDNTTGSVDAMAMATSSNAVYVTGRVSGTVPVPGGQSITTQGYDIFLGVFSPSDGHLIQLVVFGSTGSGEAPTDVAVDDNGVSIVGRIEGGDLTLDPSPPPYTSSRRDSFVSRWVFTGIPSSPLTHAWTRQFANVITAGAIAVGTTSAGETYVLSDWCQGGVPNGTCYGDADIRKFDSGGNLILSRMLSLGTYGSAGMTKPVDMVVGPSGVYIIAQPYDNWGGPNRNRVLKLDLTTLDNIWSSGNRPGMLVNGGQPKTLCLEGAVLYVGGTTWTSSGEGPDGVVARLYASSGAPIGQMEVFPSTTGFVPTRIGVSQAGVVASGLVGVDWNLQPVPPSQAMLSVVFLAAEAQGVVAVLDKIEARRGSAEKASAVDCDGNTYVAFSSTGIVDPEVYPNNYAWGGSYLRKYDSNHGVVWTRFIGCCEARAVTIDHDRVIVAGDQDLSSRPGVPLALAGETAAGSGRCCVFVGCWNVDGNQIWLRAFRDMRPNQVHDIHAAANVLLVAGELRNTLMGMTLIHAEHYYGEAFVLRVDPENSGSLLWMRGYCYSSGNPGNSISIGADEYSFYVAGNTGAVGSVYNGTMNTFLFKADLATGGTIAWTNLEGWGNTDVDIPEDLVITSQGVFVGGTVRVSGIYRPFIRLYSFAGSAVADWQPPECSIIRALGEHEGSVYFVGSGAQYNLSQVIAGKLGSTPGTVEWSVPFGTRGATYATGIGACDECLCVSGYTYGSFDDSGWVTTSGNYLNGFLARIRPPNRAPVADAGPALTVDEWTQVTLDGSGSADPEGQTLTYSWSQVGGTPVTLSSTTQAQVSFQAPWVEGVDSVTLTFQLVVSDGQLSSPPAIVNVTVKNVNNAPKADAGDPQVVAECSIVSLDASRSYDPEGETVGFYWTQILGPTVVLDDPLAAKPRFVAPLAPFGELLRFQVGVMDGVLSSSDTVDITVVNVNLPPTVDAGDPQTIDEAKVVTLAGTASDRDCDPLTCLWTQISGPAVQFADATSPSTTFVAPVLLSGDVEVVLALTASDGLLSTTDTVTITIRDSNAPPVCHAARASPDGPWPPDHKLIPITILGVADPEGRPVQITITSVTQDEPTNGLGDGDTAPDAVFSGSQLLVRAERSALGNGRFYRITFSATDDLGQTGSGVVFVIVPSSRKWNDVPVNDGTIYDSTQ